MLKEQLRSHGTTFILGTDRVKMDVLDQFTSVAVRLDQMGLVVALEEVPGAVAVEADAVGCLQPAPHIGQVRSERLCS